MVGVKFVGGAIVGCAGIADNGDIFVGGTELGTGEGGMVGWGGGGIDD